MSWPTTWSGSSPIGRSGPPRRSDRARLEVGSAQARRRRPARGAGRGVVVGFAGITWQWWAAVVARDAAQLDGEKARKNFDQAIQLSTPSARRSARSNYSISPGCSRCGGGFSSFAKDYYQEFQREQGDDPTLIRELGQLHPLGSHRLRTGRHHWCPDQPPQGQGHPGRAPLRQPRRQAPPGPAWPDASLEIEDVDSQIDRANIYSDILTYNFNNTSTMTSASLMDCPITSGYPKTFDYLCLLGRSYDLYGQHSVRNYALRELGRVSEEVYRHAQKRVRQATPVNVEAARRLAESYADLGSLYQQTGHHADGVPDARAGPGTPRGPQGAGADEPPSSPRPRQVPG